MKATNRPLTNDELDAIVCLAHVSYPVASWDKRFNREVLQPAHETQQLSDKAVAQLWRLFIRYRRQFQHPKKAHLLNQANKLAAVDFRKQRATEEAKAKIEQLKAQAQETP